MKLKFTIFLMVSFFILPLSLSHAQVQKKHILILNSYHKGYLWSDNVMEGVGSVLKKEGIEVHTEYMDTKRIQDNRHFQNLFELYQHKFEKYKFDVVIASDDNALKFLLKYRDKLFPDIPVVFCGVNNFEESMLLGHQSITGVAEDIDIKSTIDIASKLHPKTRKVYVIGDRSKSGKSNTEKVKKIIPEYQESIHFIFWDDFEAGELKEELKKLPDDSIVLFFNFFRDRSGKYFSLKEQMLLVAEHSRVPVYTCWAYRIQYGIMGGMAVNGFYHGKTAAEMALKILKGEKADNIPVLKKSPNKYMFDYKQLKRFKVLFSQLPEESIVLNRPSPFYSVYKGIIWITFIVLICFVISILFFIANIQKRRLVEKKLKKSEAKYLDLYNNAPDMFVSVDAKTAEIIECNQTLACNLGYQKRDIVGRSVFDVYHPDCLENVKKNFKSFAETGRIDYKELQLKRKDGSKIDVSLNVTAIRDKKGNVLSSRAIWRDITELKRAEEETNRIGRILEESLNEVYIFDAESLRFLQVNKGARINLNYSMEELKELTLLDLKPDLTYESFARLIEPLKTGKKEKVRFETVHKRKDGSLYPVEVYLQTSVFESRLVFVSIILDITERKCSEERVREKSDQLKSLYELSRKISSIVSKEELLPWIADQAAKLLDADVCFFRIKKGDYLIKAGGTEEVSDLIAVDKIKIGEHISGKIAEKKMPIIVEDIGKDERFSKREAAKEYGYKSFLGVPMMMGDTLIGVLNVVSKEPAKFTENDIEILSSFADMSSVALENAKLFKELEQKINDQKRAEEALRESERRLVEAQKIAKVGDWNRNFKNNTVTWSDEVYRIYGVSRKSYYGTFEAFLELIHPEDREALKDAVNSSLSKRKPLDIVFRTIRPDGTERILNSKGKVDCDYSGEPVRMVGTIQDITDIKQAEEKIKKSLKEKELLLKEIHHRVKNNMQVISSILVLQSALIEDENTTDIFKQCQDRIKSMGMIHDKLYQTEELANIDFEKYTKALTDYLLISYKKHNEKVSMGFDIENVFLDIDTAVPLSLIMNELITNALKYAFKGKDEGQIDIRLKEIDDHELVLNIKDNGVGLPEDLDVRNTETLGLEIVSILAESQLKGRIDITRNGGTDFQIIFKRKKVKI